MPCTYFSFKAQKKGVSFINYCSYKLSDKRYEIPFTDEKGKKDINIYIDPYKEHKNRSLNNKKCDLCSQKLFKKSSIQIICGDIFHFNCFRRYIINQYIYEKSPIICCPNHLEIKIFNKIYDEIRSTHEYLYPGDLEFAISKEKIQNSEIYRKYERENNLNQLETDKVNLNFEKYKEVQEAIIKNFKFHSQYLYKEITEKLNLFKYIVTRIYSKDDFDTKAFIDLVIKNIRDTSKLHAIKIFFSPIKYRQYH
ncbi:2688_t:CDS:1 [Dentiscutata heterogama]|uniref:2688_t:CDS:1 n=1 Tax=Dentiscutata heterogama TaxID=1316150 RepID=A0ACA9N0R3_9GLOM|nr:2688_t:CDS:1 [Dentiscutata heterogama]